MKTVYVICIGDDHSGEMSLALNLGAQVISWKLGNVLPLAARNSDEIFYRDLRAASCSEVSDELTRLHNSVGAECRMVVAASRSAKPAIQIQARLGGAVTGMIIWDVESVADILRAELNDPSHCAAMCTALVALLAHLPASTHPIVREVLGSGLRSCYVKQVAAVAGHDRGTPNRQSRSDRGFTATRVARLARACAASVMLRGSALSLMRVAELSGYDRIDSLNSLMRAVFKMNSRDIRGDGGDDDPCIWLADMLDRIL